MADTSKVRQRQAYAMGTAPKVGSAGGNPYKAGNAAQGSGSQSANKMPSSGVPSNCGTIAKPKG